MKKLLLFIPCIVALSACQAPLTREQELAIYRSRCLDYGFQPGTIEFAQCMQGQEAQEAQLHMQKRTIQAIETQNWTEHQKLQVKQAELELKRKKLKHDKKKWGEVISNQ